ncbi:MAG: glycosyltransferase [Nibricoccus sp.]
MAEAPWGGSEELWAGTATAALKQGWQVQACLPAFKDVHPKRAALVKAGVAVTSWTYDDIRKWNVASTNPSAGAEAAALNPYRNLVHPKPDLLLISHGGLMDMVNGHGGILSELWSSGVPYVIIIQANTEGYWPNDTQRHFMRSYFAGALQVVFVSRQNLEFARRQVADPLTNAVVWQQPVNLASLKPVKWPKEPVLQLASVARLDVGSKGQDMLLEILATPAWRERSWTLNLYGTGPSAGLLQDTVALAGIGDRVRFHGQVSDVSQIWRDNHALVMPSRLEGTPLALLEALCCGRPAMATDVGGSADWLIAGKTGFVAKAPRIEQLSEAMEQLWQNRSALPGMGEAAARFIEQSFHPRPGESLLNYLAARLRAYPKAATVREESPLLSIVRVVSKKTPSEFNVGFTNNTEVETIVVFAGSSAQGTEGKRSLIIHEPLKNPAVAANTGLLAARGGYALLVENDDEISEDFLTAALASLKQKDAPTLLCAKPSTVDNAVPTLGIFSLYTWRSAGGYPANAQADFQAWFWQRLKARGEKAEPVAKVSAAKRAPKLSEQPRVTVVVTCYNYARYLERCIDSVLAQDFEDFEIVIVNDGSTDISPLVADWIAGLHPEKVRVLHQRNSGQPAISRNNGIQVARGELILPLDADDWIAPSMLRECVAALDANPTAGVAYTDALYCHESGQSRIQPSGEFSVAALREHNRLSCCSMFRKKAWTKVGGYRTNVRGYEDWDFWLATAAAGFTGQHITKPIFFYRAKETGVNSETIAHDKSRRARIKLNNPSCYSADERAQAQAFLASELAAQNTPPAPVADNDSIETLRQTASTCYQSGDWAGCVNACEKALKQAPDDCDVLLVYADALAKTGQVPAALAAMERVIRLEPEVEDHKQMRAGFSAMLTTAAPRGLVSVIVPCDNQSSFLAETVESVVAQTYSNWELIIVNDGSSDDTNAVAQSLILKHSSRTIRLIEKTNGGLSDARNSGINFAQGGFILPLDAGDKIHPEFLAKTVGVLEANPDIAIAYTDWAYFGAHKTARQSIDYHFERLCTKENLFAYAALYRKAAWTAAGGYNTNMTKGLEEWDFWIGCGKRGFTGKRIPEPLFFHRAKPGSTGHAAHPHLREIFARIVLNHPDIYNTDLAANAGKVVAGAKFPPAKPSSAGTEWLSSPKTETGHSLASLKGKRVLIYCDDPGQGGAAHYNHHILLALQQAGAAVFSAQPKSESPMLDEQQKAGIKHAWISYNPVEAFNRSLTDEEDPSRIVAEVRPDIVFFSDCCAVSNLAAKRVVMKNRIPFLLICHSEAGYLAERFASAMPVVKEVLAQAVEVIAVSNSSREVLRKSFGLPANKGTVIYSGRPERYFADPVSSVRNKLRAEMRIPEDAMLCFTAARLDSAKGFQFQLEAMRLLKEANRLGKLYFAWAGDGDARGQLEQIIDRHQLGDRVRVLGYRWDIADLMDAADVFVLTSMSEALPLCIMEAMAKGLPVIATTVGGIPEELGDAGKLVPNPNTNPTGTVTELANTLAAWAEKPALRREAGAKLKQRATDMFRQAPMIEKTLNVLALAAGQTSGRSTAPVTAPNHEGFNALMTAAEALVREHRHEEAKTKITEALQIAPDAQHRTRAQEILDLLGSPVAGNSEQASDSTTEEFFGADEVKTIEQLIVSHSQNPHDPAVRGQLEELQQGLMNFLVTAETEKLEALFKGSFGKVFRALAASGLVAEQPTEKSQAQIAILDEAISGASTDGFDFRPVLARMLCAPAHRGSLNVSVDKIPAWFLNDYLAHVLHAPSVFVYAGEAEEYHDHMLGWAQAIFQLTRTAPNNAVTLSAATFFATRANYIPLYFSNRNTREVAEKRAAIMEFFLLKNGAAIDFKTPKRPKDRKKIKVGIVSAHFGQQTETHVTLPSLQLDRSRFEICLFAQRSNPGPLEDRCRSFADSFTELPSKIHDQVKAIRDAALDVAIIGTNITAVTNQISLIALHRLAPLQLVNYCSPVSTGMRHIDGYLTGSLNDLPGLQEQFTEKLQFCEGPPGCLDYAVEAKVTAEKFTRAGLGLPENEIVFVNAAACFKILPELQETWAKILQAVPNSRLLLLPFNPNWSSAFPVKQFERTLSEACARHGVSADRFAMAGSLPSRADVKSLLSVADVYLDTAPFSGSISVIDPLELGLPPVVWEGKTHRSRMAAALLRELNIPELIVQDEAAYIALSVKLATDRAWRKQIGARILEAMARKPKFINAPAYAKGLGELIESLVSGKTSPALATSNA